MKADPRNQLLELLQVSRALLRSMDDVLSSRTNERDAFHFASYKTYAVQYNRLIEAFVRFGVADQGILVTYDTEKMPGIGDTLDIQQRSFFQSIHGSLSMLCAFLESNVGIGETSHDLRGLREFLTEKLRPAMLDNQPESEKVVQNTVEQLLIGRGMQKGVDYDRETGRVKHSGKASCAGLRVLSPGRCSGGEVREG